MDDVMFSSTTDEWATPQPLFEQIANTFGPFDLDPCARPENTKAASWYGWQGSNLQFIDGLRRQWFDMINQLPGNVFVNPPFCREKKMYVDPWIEKAWDEVQLGHSSQVVMLIPARTDTKVWHNTVMRHADFIGFVKGRVRFVRPDGTDGPAPFPSAIVVFRRRPGAEAFPPYVASWEQP